MAEESCMKRHDILIDSEAALEKLQNDNDLYREFLIMYQSDAPGLLETLELLINPEDIEKAEMAAHSLKSTSRIIGADYLGGIAAQIEAAIHDKNLEKAKDIIPQLKSRFELVIGEIESIIR
jgi:HPt (histidine-containing phosphotransfer) domain-containing protein